MTAISGQTVERSHLYAVHLGETVAPYVLLEPLQALLPVKRGEYEIPAERSPRNLQQRQVDLGGLDRRMRERWQTISRLWEDNKAAANQLSLLGQLDYLHKLTAQMEWQKAPGDRPIRVIYTASGEPTAAVVLDDDCLLESNTYWIACKDFREAHYLLAIINSTTLANAVNPLTVPNWSGKTRHLQKHLWKLPIPEFDPSQKLHLAISRAGERTAAAASARLAELRVALERQGRRFTVTIARRELRAWLRTSPEGREVEATVAALLGRGD